jgi:hypothetical protein
MLTTLTGKYNAGLSFNIRRNNWGCAILALFEKWDAAESSHPAGTICRWIPPPKARPGCPPTKNEFCNNYSVIITLLWPFNHTLP